MLATAYALRPSPAEPSPTNKSQQHTELVKLHGLQFPPLSSINGPHPKHSDPNDDPEKLVGELMCDAICDQDELYAILGLQNKAKQDDIRRAFLSRSRLCHPESVTSSEAGPGRILVCETLSVANATGVDDWVDKQTAGLPNLNDGLSAIVVRVQDAFKTGDAANVRPRRNAAHARRR